MRHCTALRPLWRDPGGRALFTLKNTPGWCQSCLLNAGYCHPSPVHVEWVVGLLAMIAITSLRSLPSVGANGYRKRRPTL